MCGPDTHAVALPTNNLTYSRTLRVAVVAASTDDVDHLISFRSDEAYGARLCLYMPST